MKYTSEASKRVINKMKDNIVPLQAGENLQRVEVRNEAAATVIVGYGNTVDVDVYDLVTATDVATIQTGAAGTGGAIILASDRPFNAISFDISSASGAIGDVYFGGTTEVSIDDGSDDYKLISPDLTSATEQVLFFAHAGEIPMNDSALIALGWPEGKYCLAIELASGTLTSTIQAADILTHAKLAADSTLIDDPARQIPRGANLIVLQETADNQNVVNVIKSR